MTTKWYETKSDKQKRSLAKARLAKQQHLEKQSHTRSYNKLVKRAKLLDNPSVVCVSASGIKSSNKDVQQYLKKNKLCIRAGVLRKL
jgi:hypothetical protein